MECKHDPIYQRENEAQGGAGCPLCHRERRAAVVMPPAGTCPVCGRNLTEVVPFDTVCPQCAARWFEQVKEIEF